MGKHIGRLLASLFYPATKRKNGNHKRSYTRLIITIPNNPIKHDLFREAWDWLYCSIREFSSQES